MDIMAKSVLLDSLFTVCNDWRGMGVTLSWANPPVQLDAVFGTVNALQEMLFCWQKEALSILPALPERLQSGVVRGMVFPGGKIDILWEDSGRVEITILALQDLDTDILFAGKAVGHIRLDQSTKKTLVYHR